MPRKPSALSLKEISLKSVATHLEHICYGCKKGSKVLAAMIHSEEYIAIVSPFVDWPSNLLEELSKVVYSVRAGQKHLLHPIIQPQLTSFAIQLHGSTHAAMNFLQERCSKTLKCLEVVYNNNLPPNYYNDFFRHFKHLTKLNVCASMVDDTGFIAIGETCSKLVELNAGSTWITNNGIKQLCLDSVIIPGLPQGSYRCPDLVILDLSNTKVTLQGLSLFVACHPNVAHLEHPETFHCFDLVKTQQTCGQDYRLNTLASTHVHMNADTFEYALDHSSQFLEKVTITSAGLANENLYRLMTCDKLTSLHLGNKYSSSFNFYEGLAPVLETCGPQLKKLVLEEFTEVDLNIIGAKCPILEHLALSGTTTYAPVLQLNPLAYNQLSSIELWNNMGQEMAVCSSSLRQLLTFAPLTYILLQRVANITDDLLASILYDNPLLALRNVVLDYCHNITVATLWRLLLQPNQLSVLRCWHCKGVEHTAKVEMKKAIKEENLLLYFEWFPYNEYEEMRDAGVLQEDSDDEEG